MYKVLHTKVCTFFEHSYKILNEIIKASSHCYFIILMYLRVLYVFVCVCVKIFVVVAVHFHCLLNHSYHCNVFKLNHQCIYSFCCLFVCFIIILKYTLFSFLIVTLYLLESSSSLLY